MFWHIRTFLLINKLNFVRCFFCLCVLQLSELVKRIKQDLAEAKSALIGKQEFYEERLTEVATIEKAIVLLTFDVDALKSQVDLLLFYLIFEIWSFWFQMKDCLHLVGNFTER